MHDITLLGTMGAFLDAVFADIDRARRRVLVECYIVRSDKLGRALGERLVAAVRRGVRAQLLYDPFGSVEADPDFFRALAAEGVEVRPFSKKGIFGQLNPRPRNHSRMVVTDDAAYTGGFAWADPWLPASLGGGGWHDVACRLTGPVVDDFVLVFQQRWRESQGRGGGCKAS